MFSFFPLASFETESNECKISFGELTSTDKELICFFFLGGQKGEQIKINFGGVP